MDKQSTEENRSVSADVVYRVAYETRNLELSLFWQRSNYFLVLSTATVAGLFALKGANWAYVLGAFGFSVSVLWFLTNLGSKFWFVRWEQRLRDTEKALDLPAPLFLHEQDTVQRDVLRALSAPTRSWMRRRYDWLVRKKPSVSMLMSALPALFALFWITVVVLTLNGAIRRDDRPGGEWRYRGLLSTGVASSPDFAAEQIEGCRRARRAS